MSDHRQGRLAGLADRLEANRFVEATRWIAVIDAETQSLILLSLAGPDEADEEQSSDSLVTTGCDRAA